MFRLACLAWWLNWSNAFGLHAHCNGSGLSSSSLCAHRGPARMQTNPQNLHIKLGWKKPTQEMPTNQGLCRARQMNTATSAWLSKALKLLMPYSRAFDHRYAFSHSPSSTAFSRTGNQRSKNHLASRLANSLPATTCRLNTSHARHVV